MDAAELIPIFARHLNAEHDEPLQTDIIETVVEIFLASGTITGDVEEDASNVAAAIQSLPDAAEAVADADDVAERIADDARQRLLRLRTRRPDWFAGGPDVAEGACVLAVLAEDGEWHDATVVTVADTPDASHGATATTLVTVAFDEFAGMVREIPLSEIILVSGANEDEAGDNHSVGIEGRCELCLRDTKVTDHHLIPRSEHSRFVKRGYKMSFLKGRDNIAELCRPCHTTVHRFASNKDLAESYDTTAKLRQEESIQRWISWVGSQSHGKHRRDHHHTSSCQ
eukprot:m.8169 g.8169  ORF g.8169 m.8169 type:complete len:284 (+) comp2508_c0_seq2:318-1169(+)